MTTRPAQSSRPTRPDGHLTTIKAEPGHRVEFWEGTTLTLRPVHFGGDWQPS